jgi:fatty-acyl-CoA synthase
VPAGADPAGPAPTAAAGDPSATRASVASPLAELLARQCLSDPEAPAIEFGGEVISRAGFAALIGAELADLQARGLGAGAMVGWLGWNTPQMLACFFACARLGAVFVPLNWRLAAPELLAILRHAGLDVLLNTPEFDELAARLREQAPMGAAIADRVRPEPGDLMLVYTSGTTGQPKGAVHTQAGMLANLQAATAVQGLTSADRVLSLLPLFHVGGLCIQTLPALCCGAVLRLHARFDPGAWLRDVAQWRPTTSLLVPAVMRAILDHPDFAATELSSLAYLNSGSSIVPVALIEAFHARGVPVAQVYGSTETGPFSIALRPDEALARVGQVGRPAPGVELRLVDEVGREVATGEVGEVWLKAANLMRGYHRDPANPGFAAGWFHSGDLGRQDDAGHVQIVGRAKDMIISGGENIHPAEIENLVLAWPGVAEAVVVGLPDERWGEVPVLVLVPVGAGAAGAVAIDVEGLRQHLAGRLARYKQPRRIEVLAELPRTALGKVQKAAVVKRLRGAATA